MWRPTLMAEDVVELSPPCEGLPVSDEGARENKGLSVKMKRTTLARGRGWPRDPLSHSAGGAGRRLTAGGIVRDTVYTMHVPEMYGQSRSDRHGWAY